MRWHTCWCLQPGYRWGREPSSIWQGSIGSWYRLKVEWVSRRSCLQDLQKTIRTEITYLPFRVNGRYVVLVRIASDKGETRIIRTYSSLRIQPQGSKWLWPTFQRWWLSQRQRGPAEQRGRERSASWWKMDWFEWETKEATVANEWRW